jgi:hypothetical protein
MAKRSTTKRERLDTPQVTSRSETRRAGAGRWTRWADHSRRIAARKRTGQSSRVTATSEIVAGETSGCRTSLLESQIGHDVQARWRY